MSSPAKKVLHHAGGGACRHRYHLPGVSVHGARLPPATTRDTDGQGTQRAVEVLRDRNGVPHIRAATMHDLYFAQGYVTAQDRFWQMDFWRRSARGGFPRSSGNPPLAPTFT